MKAWIGWMSEDYPSRGTTNFSETSTEYSGSIVEGYVNNYSSYLRNTLNIENTATLISKEELEEIVGLTLSVGNNLLTLAAPAFLYSTSYWTRSAHDADVVWYVRYAGVFNRYSYNIDIYAGVRPVITIDNEEFTRVIVSEPEPETQITYTDVDNSGTKNLGDTITISKEGASTEEFYIIKDDGETIQMLSKYNLYIGGTYYETGWGAYENPTGIQDSTMIGYVDEGLPFIGTTPFSSDSQKGTNYSDYSGSLVEIYVNNYNSYLKNTMKIENIASLIDQETLEYAAGQSLTTGVDISTIGAPAWLYSTSYWTRWIDDADYLFCVYSDGYFGFYSYTNTLSFGVRLLVSIASSLVE